ncbi:hypothetical protein [uncultured Alistipes sp.]|uniref:hypothetical protein n=1 Tax=uncultured Alistipes sp. TaxID=538949 RepID=UPI00261966D9|nr:hypothetical protein [uncultured Alistipes sp.]
MKRKTVIWIAIIAVVVIIIIAGVGGGSDSNGTETDGTMNSEKNWVELISVSGSGDKKSVEFEYSGGKAKLHYNFQADDSGAFAVYVVKEGSDVMTEGGFPEVMLDGAEEGDSNLSHLQKGTYYLNVMSANGKWTISVEELK